MILLSLLISVLPFSSQPYTVTEKAWLDLSKGNYSSARQGAVSCIESNMDDDLLRKFYSSPNNVLLEHYYDFIPLSRQAECFYIIALSYERENYVGEAIKYYEIIIERYKGLWVGFPGTMWQPSEISSEALSLLEIDSTFNDPSRRTGHPLGP
jgi:hypothetical protein